VIFPVVLRQEDVTAPYWLTNGDAEKQVSARGKSIG
jgi:hypothetical protein